MSELNQSRVEKYVEEYKYMNASELSRLILKEINDPNLTF